MICGFLYAQREYRCPNCSVTRPMVTVPRSRYDALHAPPPPPPETPAELLETAEGDAVIDAEARTRARQRESGGPTLASEREAEVVARVETDDVDLDLVLGGGYVRGKFYGLHGPEGCGKSRLALRSAARVCKVGPVVYATTTEEETAGEVTRHVKESGFFRWPHVKRRLHILHADDTEQLVAEASAFRPVLLVVDSASVLQSLLCPRDDRQGIHAAQVLRSFAHDLDCVVIALFQLTNQGLLAGGRKIRFLCDAILEMHMVTRNRSGRLVRTEEDETSDLVRLRSAKNRYAPKNAQAYFELVDEGLREIPEVIAPPPEPEEPAALAVDDDPGGPGDVPGRQGADRDWSRGRPFTTVTAGMARARRRKKPS